MNEYPVWFAVNVKARQERFVAQRLRGKGLEEFLPLYHPDGACSGRRKAVYAPLFPGYVFCRVHADRWLPILKTRGVTSIVSYGCNPAPVPDREIEAVRIAIASGLPLRCWRYPCTGQQVRVESGSLASLHGVLMREGDALRVVIRIGPLRQSVAVDVPRDMICAVEGSAYAPTAQLYLTA